MYFQNLRLQSGNPKYPLAHSSQKVPLKFSKHGHCKVPSATQKGRPFSINLQKKMVINDGSTTIIITYRNVFSSELKTSSKYANEIFSQFAIARAQKGEIKKL